LANRIYVIGAPDRSTTLIYYFGLAEGPSSCGDGSLARSGAQVETRLWHRDLRIAKIIVYLNDVDRGEVPMNTSTGESWPLGDSGRNTGRIDDDLMNQLAPASVQHACSGPRSTVVFTDTCSVFHGGSIAHSEDRLALFFCYNSKSPRGPINCKPLFDLDLFARNSKDLSSAQLSAIGH
jgi:hypothetical protein